MKVKYKLGMMVAARSEAAPDVLTTTQYGVIDRIITKLEGTQYQLEGFETVWKEDEIIMAYRPIPGSGVQKKRVRRKRAANETSDDQNQLPLQAEEVAQ